MNPSQPSDRAAAIIFDSKGRPDVVAQGSGAFARQILEMAFAHGIPVREDKDLAEILAALDPETEIPPMALGALGEILIYLYRANAKKAEGHD